LFGIQCDKAYKFIFKWQQFYGEIYEKYVIYSDKINSLGINGCADFSMSVVERTTDELPSVDA